MTGLDFFVALVGRERAWRLSRKLYMSARGEVHNGIHVNGEVTLIRAALARKRAEDKTGPFIAFDVGANLGLYSKEILAAVGGDVLDLTAFEPAPSTFARLTAELGDERVRLENIALSARSGAAELQVVGETAGTNTLVPGDSTGERVSVRLDTLDAYVAARGLPRIDLLKIDTEGHDLDVLRGGAGLFKDGRIAIAQFEYNHRWLFGGASLYAVFKMFEGLPYAIGRVGPAGVQLFDSWNPELDRFFEGNYALIGKDALAHVPHVQARLTASNIYVTS